MRRVAAVVVASGLWVGCHVDERFSTLHMKQPEVSDPFMLRMGVGYSIDYLLHRRPPRS